MRSAIALKTNVLSPTKHKQIVFGQPRQGSNSPKRESQHHMNGIAQSVQILQMENDDACVGVYKEAASKVVEL